MKRVKGSPGHAGEESQLLMESDGVGGSWEERKPGSGAMVLDKMQLCC